MHDETLLTRAVEFAQRKHAGQTDKCGKPYIDHVIRVGNFLLAAGHSKAAIAAGYLHDVVEDTDATLDDIAEQFGGDVAGLVDALSRRETETYGQYISRLRLTPGAAHIKIADVLNNMNPDRKPRPYEYDSMLSRYYHTLKTLIVGVRHG